MSGPPIKQPLGPQAIGKIKSKQQNKVSYVKPKYCYLIDELLSVMNYFL
jgi:hypothetical protein